MWELNKAFLLANGKQVNNPRQKRALAALWNHAQTREALDRISGSSNSPDVIARLRSKGLDIPCTTISVTDRDGKNVRPGVYRLTPEDLLKIAPCIASLRRLLKE